MASDAQIAANRRNAGRSTGPKTPEGKEISRGNALRHGLAAKQVVALDERGADFAAFHAELIGALLPQDAFEATLVRRLALLSWRLDRLCRIEAGVLDASAEFHRHEHVWPFDMNNFARYESALDRAFKRAMSMLERRQTLRRRESVDAGAAMVATPAPAPAPSPPAAVPGARPREIIFLRNEANSGAAVEPGEGALPHQDLRAAMLSPATPRGEGPVPPPSTPEGAGAASTEGARATGPIPTPI